MTGKLAGQIMRSGFLKGARSDVLLALASVSDRHGQSWHSYTAMAHMARRSRKSAIVSVRWLKTTELVDVQRGRYIQTLSGRYTGSSNLYTLNLEFFEGLIFITESVRNATPGGAEEKWAAVKRAADWAEALVERFEWRLVVELAQRPPQFIKQCVFGVEPITLPEPKSLESTCEAGPYNHEK